MAVPGQPRRCPLDLVPGSPPTKRGTGWPGEHAALLGTPFSGEAARYARQLAAAQDRLPDQQAALAGLLERWSTGMVTGRRERRMAARLAAERPAIGGGDDPGADLTVPPGAAAARPPAAEAAGDDDCEEEIFDTADDFYAGAFEVIA